MLHAKLIIYNYFMHE